MNAIDTLTREQALILFPDLELPETASNIPVLHVFDFSSEYQPEEGYCHVSRYFSVTYETKDMWHVGDLILDWDQAISNYLDNYADEIPELEALEYKNENIYYEQVMAILIQKYGTIKKAFAANNQDMEVYQVAPYILIKA